MNPTRRWSGCAISTYAIRSTGTTTRRPRSSTRVSRPSLVEPDMAAATSAAISSGVLGLSMTSSRGECWTPILTSTWAMPPRFARLPPTLAQRRRRGGPTTVRRQRTPSSLRGLVALDPRETGDAPPGQRRHQRDGLVAGDRALARQPPAGTRLGRPGEAGGQQQGALGVGAGVGRDHLGDG